MVFKARLDDVLLGKLKVSRAHDQDVKETTRLHNQKERESKFYHWKERNLAKTPSTSNVLLVQKTDCITIN